MDSELPLAALSIGGVAPTPVTERVRRAAAGDRAAFEELARAEWSHLVRLARIVLAGDLEAEDVAQEALLDAWRHLPALRDPERFGAWLRRSLVRRALRRLKRRRSETAAVVLEPRPVGARPELLLDVERLLASLPARCRAAFFLTEIDGVTDAEAARLLGVTAATVRVQRFLARRKLRGLIGGETR